MVEPRGDLDQPLHEDALITREYCRPGCGACLDNCPYDVPVDDIFRYAMYSENYRQPRSAATRSR